MFETKIDRFAELVRERRRTFEELAAELGISVVAAERIGSMLEKGKAVQLHYPVNIFQKPYVSFGKMLEERKTGERAAAGKVLEKYELEADFVPAWVRITDDGRARRYEIEFADLGMATRVFLDSVKDELTTKVPAEFQDMGDIEKGMQVKGEFMKMILAHIGAYELGEKAGNVLSGMLLHTMFGLGELDVLTHDNWLEEIAVNDSKTPIGVYHRRLGWMKSNLFMPSEDEIFNYASQIGRKVGRQIAVLTPIMDARLETGDRVNATLMPISSHGNTITIRRFARNPWTIISLIDDPVRTMTSEMAALLWQAIHYELNIIVAGGTASGKTSTLNALAAFVPPNQRIITIEDTRELRLPKYQWNWIPLLKRNANPEGLGEVSMLDLLITSLRMRPDRIILGEMRKQNEAEVLFEAMHTGHSVYATLHADTSAQVIKRLTQPPISVPPSEIEALHLLLVQYRDRRKNLRRTLEISEVVSGTQTEQLMPNIVYRWRPRSDAFERIGESSKFFAELNLHTGMTKQEIIDDARDRTKILKYMIKNKISQVDDVGRVFALYYSDPTFVLEAAEKEWKPSKLA